MSAGSYGADELSDALYRAPVLPYSIAIASTDQGCLYVGDGHTFICCEYRGEQLVPVGMANEAAMMALTHTPTYFLAAIEQIEKPTPRPADQWHCGNGHLADQAALRLIERNGINDAATMEWLADALRGAGPGYAIDCLERDGVPF